MTATVDAPQASAPSSADPTVRQRWRRWRTTIGVLATGLVVIAVAVILRPSGHGGDLDPRSYDATGTHALAALLGERGVRVDTETTVAAATATAAGTLVVVNPGRLDDSSLAELAGTPADLVVVGAGPAELEGLGLGVRTAGEIVGPMTVDPGCGLPAARTAGSIIIGAGAGESTGAFAYRTPPGGMGCYPAAGGHAVVSFARDGRQITLVGDGAPLTNDKLATAGDAALALGLLDAHPDVVWLVPALIAPASGARHASLTSLLPSRLKWAFLQLVIAVVVIALWRGRRFGRLTPERLPVVVRQAETVVGRARLYRRARSLDRAADALRAGARDRTARRLGLGNAYPPDALVDAVSARLRPGRGRSAREVAALLYGPTPADDRELVSLAQELATLEREVRAS